jgi:hypothetical protein
MRTEIITGVFTLGGVIVGGVLNVGVGVALDNRQRRRETLIAIRLLIPELATTTRQRPSGIATSKLVASQFPAHAAAGALGARDGSPGSGPPKPQASTSRRRRHLRGGTSASSASSARCAAQRSRQPLCTVGHG